MSEWNKFCTTAKKTAETIASKTGEVVDHAATKLKIKGLELRKDEQYETLGRLVYRSLRTGEDTEEERNQAVAEIDALNEKITALKEKCSSEKAPAAEEAPGEEPAKETGDESQAPSCEGTEHTDI